MNNPRYVLGQLLKNSGLVGGVLLAVVFATPVLASSGSGIAVDELGNSRFSHTGQVKQALDALKLLLRTVTGDQTDNGSWASWPETRPPFFGNSDQSMTTLAALSLLPESARGEMAAKSAVEKAVHWLEQSRSDGDPQSIAMRLVLYVRIHRPQTEWLPLVRQIQKRQRKDGGWSQTVAGPSDAWATGQALYALGHAGKVANTRIIERARTFLVRSQRENGSWTMASRPKKPGDHGAENLVPITGGGSAWAILGLVRTDFDASRTSQ